MNQSDILELRLKNQHLNASKFLNAAETVRWFGAVQSQDFNAAKWSLGVRIKGSTDNSIEKDFNEGKIIRTHVMRPTWHFIAPEDLRWMQKLTSHSVKKLMSHYNRKLELTDNVFKKTERLIVSALKNNNYLTRQEIKIVLTKANIETDTHRLGHIVSWLELAAIICSGPKKGKVQSYALTDERIKSHLDLSREASLSELAKRYFQSHGPAQIKDFSWWSGLTVKESREAILMLKPSLTSVMHNEKEYWYFPTTLKTNNKRLTTTLLSVYDEFFIAYKDRSLILDPKYKNEMATVGNALLTSLVIINGKVTGTWKRKINKKGVEIKLNLFKKLTREENKNIEKLIPEYTKFIGRSVIIAH